MVAGGEKQQERERKGKEQRHQKIQRRDTWGKAGEKETKRVTYGERKEQKRQDRKKAGSEKGLEYAEFWSKREARCVMQPSGDSRNKLGFEMRDKRSGYSSSFASFSTSSLTCV